MAEYQEVKPQRSSVALAEVLILDTNVAIDIEDFFYGFPRALAQRPDLRQLLIRHSNDQGPNGTAPDVQYGWALLEACRPRVGGFNELRYRRMQHALKVVTAWDAATIDRNFENRHPPAARDRDVRRGLPLPEAIDDNPFVLIGSHYGSLLYLCHLDRTRSRWKRHGRMWAVEEFVRWMSQDFGVRGSYVTQLALDLFLGDDDRRNGARKLLKLGGSEAPDKLADQCWNAAWDIFFLSSTEGLTFGLGPGEMSEPQVADLITQNYDPGFVRLLAEVRVVFDFGVSRQVMIENDWSQHPGADDVRLRACLAPRSMADQQHPLSSSPEDLLEKVVNATRNLELELGVQSSSVDGIVSRGRP